MYFGYHQQSKRKRLWVNFTPNDSAYKLDAISKIDLPFYAPKRFFRYYYNNYIFLLKSNRAYDKKLWS